MSVDFEAIKNLTAHVSEASETRSTDAPYLRSVRIAIQALKEGATIKDAFDVADLFAERIMREKGRRNGSSQP